MELKDSMGPGELPQSSLSSSLALSLSDPASFPIPVDRGKIPCLRFPRGLVSGQMPSAPAGQPRTLSVPLLLMKSVFRSAILSVLIPTLASSPAFADFEKGLAAYQANKLPLAYKEFRESADAGEADSQFNVALMFEKGIGVGKDEKEAVVWYGKSAAQGNSAAQYNVAVMYENGRGTAVDFKKAHEWYRKASVQGDPLAIGNLGMLYVRGEGVKENKTAGVALLLVSATKDPSPQNLAKKNIASTRGLNVEMITAAQKLSGEMSEAKNLLVPLDAYLKKGK